MRLLKLSLIMTLEINEELLLVTLFFGFLLFVASFNGAAASSVFPSPNAGVDSFGHAASLAVPLWLSSLLLIASAEDRPSCEPSATASGANADTVGPLAKAAGGDRGSNDMRVTLVPALAG